MIHWLLRRSLQAVLTFLVVTVLLFVLMRLTPGDPLQRLAGDRQVSAAEAAALRRRFGIDQPITTQFRTFVTGALAGDLGVSIEHYPTRVSTLLVSRLPASLLLGGTVLVLTFGFGIALGALQAVRRGRRVDRWLTRVSLALYAMPSFWLGLVLAWFLPWYLMRYVYLPWPITDEIKVLGLGITTALLYWIWDSAGGQKSDPQSG